LVAGSSRVRACAGGWVVVFTAIPVLVYGGSHLPFQYR
jgi:hypothetical protein